MKMDSGTTEICSIMKYVCGESIHICRLCFASTEKEGYYLEDNVRLQKSYFDESLSFVDMFDALGLTMEPSLPEVICTSCAATIINSFLLQKMCKYSDKKWSEAIAKLELTLIDSNLENRDIQSAYIVLKESDNIIYTSKKKCMSRTKAIALSRLKYIVTRSQYVKKKKEKRIKTVSNQEDHLNVEKEHDQNGNKCKIQCPQCARLFSSRILLEEHAQRVHYPKTIQCSKCSQKFSTKKMLKRHESIHHIAAICKRCFVQFPSRNALRSHLDKHDLYKCENCSKVLINKQTYKLHMKICGNPNRKASIFFCDICGRGYCRKNSLRSHLKTDHGFGRVFSCSWCSKKYDAASKLRNHIVKHTKERNFSCEQCGGKFVTKAALIYHTRLHTGEKPFKCDLCDESFLSASRRMEHKRRRHLAPTKECTVCHVKFVTKNQLKKHVSRHYDPQSKLYVSEPCRLYVGITNDADGLIEEQII